jgi:hypothetical protein
MSSDEETTNIKQKTSKTECHTTPKPVSKRACSEEQLERLKNMRVKALEARKAKAEARKDEARRRVEEKEELKVTKEVKKLAAAKKRPTPKEVDSGSGSDSDGGSPPAAVARRPPSIDVGEKPRRRRKPVKVAVEASSSDSETEIVIRRPSRKGKAKKPSATVSSVDEEPPTPAPTGRMYSAEEVSAMMDDKLKGFKKTIDDDEVMKLIRHMMPNYK